MARIRGGAGRQCRRLPVQPIHGDLTEDNVVGRRDEAGRLMPGGVIDFGDLTRSWRVGDLAVACASLLLPDRTPTRWRFCR